MRNDITSELCLQLYKNGLNLNQIAASLNCSNTLVRNRLEAIGAYTRKAIQKAQHGTRTMYVHYGCRCEACCKAEHEQYLKRPAARQRQRKHSKWSVDLECWPLGVKKTSERKKAQNKRRNARIASCERSLSRLIHWTDLYEFYNGKCAICGCEVDPSDIWLNEKGRKCFGRNYPTVDHILPLALGGSDTFGNVQLLCKHCNSKKGLRVEVGL